MGVFILTETSSGYALLKAKDKNILKRDDLFEQSNTASGLNELLKLKNFERFDSGAVALEEITALNDGKVTGRLAKLLNKLEEGEKKVTLAVSDSKLGNAITKLPGISIKPVSDSSTNEIFRALRGNLQALVPELAPAELQRTQLGLAHSISRHKLRFSPEKVDVMIIQAVALLDDLDKILNNYAMRTKEWYGWHFPEMAKIINDNIAYARVILKMGVRSNAHDSDLSEILPEEIEGAIKAAAEISMGTDITEDDLDNIRKLASEVVELTEQRSTLSNHLTARMQAMAPNLTALVGEVVGARLISHAGSLIGLAKSPASTIQILGAEKALFRALKTKHDTPKYGLIFHASLVGQATGKNKGKVARMLAAKAALGLRIDALSDWGPGGEHQQDEPSEEQKSEIGVRDRLKVERRLQVLEGKPLRPRGVAIAPSGQPQPGKFEIKEARKYNPDADGLSANAPAAAKAVNGDATKKKKEKKLVEEVPSADEDEDMDAEVKEEEPIKANGESKADKARRKAEKAARKEAKRAKKEEKAATNGEANGDAESKKEKKKRKRDSEAAEVNGHAADKKKKKSKA